MNNSMKHHLKRIGTDIAGYGLIILGLSLGWLPGPGGIPLILSGLGLLSIHNAWARWIMRELRERGGDLVVFIFPENRTVQALHDVLVIVLISVAVYIGFVGTEYWQYGLMIALVAMAIADFGLNRSRFDRYVPKR